MNIKRSPIDVPIFDDFLWTKRRPRSIEVGPEELRSAHEIGGCAPRGGGCPLSRGRPGDPPDVKPTPKIPINTETFGN